MKRHAFSLFFLALLATPALAQDPKVIQLGVVDSLVKDLSPAKKNFVETDFGEMVHEYTGLKTKVVSGGDLATALKNLESGKWHMAVLQGVELAWIRPKDAKLTPLVVGIGKQRDLHAVLVVKKDSPLTAAAELKGKEVNLFAGSKEHCSLFANKLAGGNSKDFYGKLIRTNESETTLDEVLLGKVQAAIVDNNSLASYKEINPGRFDRLKVLAKSEPFPLGVIVYRQGGLSENALNLFREGLIKANQSDKGREALASFQMTALEMVPKDYEQQLNAILKAYPAPPK